MRQRRPYTSGSARVPTSPCSASGMKPLRSRYQPLRAWRGIPRSGPLRVLPHVWKWAEIEPYLHRIAEIAPPSASSFC